jgi:hypothetical protein
VTKQIRSPCNILFSDLVTCARSEHLRADDNYRKLVYSVLGNYAEDVEHVHRVGWKAKTRHLPPEERIFYRRRLDTFLFRVDRRLLNSVESQKLGDMEGYLNLLAEYVTNCATRVMPNQVVEVCMETLLRIKVRNPNFKCHV